MTCWKHSERPPRIRWMKTQTKRAKLCNWSSIDLNPFPSRHTHVHIYVSLSLENIGCRVLNRVSRFEDVSELLFLFGVCVCVVVLLFCNHGCTDAAAAGFSPLLLNLPTTWHKKKERERERERERKKRKLKREGTKKKKEGRRKNSGKTLGVGILISCGLKKKQR